MGRKRIDPNMTQAEKAKIKADFKRMPRLSGEEICCYASGSGALSFVWQAMDHSRGSRIATGRKVTMEDARRWLSSTKRGGELLAKGYRLWDRYGQPTLIGPVERVNENTLRIDGQTYYYHVNQADPFYVKDGEVRQSSLRLVATEADHEYLGEREHLREVRNLNMLASAAYFLTNEKAIAENPPEEFTYQVAED